MDYPADWEVKKLGEIGNFMKGAPLSKADISSSGTPMILYGELYTTYKEVTYKVKNYTKRIVDARYYSKVGDVIIPTSGETAEEIATATCVMLSGVILAGDLNIYRTNKLDGRFLSYIINHIVNKKISEIAQGISIIHIKAKELENISIPLPTLAEQKAIANTLETFDAHIKNLSELIEKKKAIRDGALEDLMSGRIRLKNFSGDWEIKKLGEIVDIIRGSSPRPIESFLTFIPDGVNWIKISDADKNEKYITKTEEKITHEGALRSVFVNEGDLILSNSMSFGRPYILKISGCIHDGWLKLYNYKSYINKEFLCYSLSSKNTYKQYLTFAAGSGVQNLNKNVVKNVLIPLPPLAEQKAIAETLTAFDDEIKALEAERGKIIKIRDGAMNDLLTGKVRLKNYGK